MRWRGRRRLGRTNRDGRDPPDRILVGRVRDGPNQPTSSWSDERRWAKDEKTRADDPEKDGVGRFTPISNRLTSKWSAVSHVCRRCVSPLCPSSGRMSGMTYTRARFRGSSFLASQMHLKSIFQESNENELIRKRNHSITGVT